MKKFMDKDFLLSTETARHLFHDYAEGLPIIDYHCHLSPQEIAEDAKFENITQVWLGGDHYKWRQMRSNGVEEKYITGDAPDREKFQKWAETLEMAIGNPLYHWSHLELQRYFGYEGVLNGDTAEEVWNLCNEKLKGMSARKLILDSNVEMLATTDDPIDDLHWHKQIAEDESFPVKVLPAWRPDKAVLHLFPHWNWTEGQDIDLWAYYNNADEVELFVNGKSQGVRSKGKDDFHVMWRVKYESGTVKAVSRKEGKTVAEQEIRTAGEPAQIRLSPDRSTIQADGKDLSFITVEILDKDGNLCPNAENDVTFAVEGAGFIAGVDNGSPISMEKFKDNHRKAFYGKCLVVLQNNGEPGGVKVTATADGLEKATTAIKVK